MNTPRRTGSRPGLLALLLLLPGALAAAPPVQPLETIERVVSAFAATAHGADDVEIAVGRLDPRLRLPRCDRELTTRHTHGRRSRGPMSVEVRCEGTKPWALYVPVTVERYAEVVIARRAVARGEMLDADHVAVERRRIDARHDDYLVDVEAVTGLLAARPIGHGQIVTRTQLERPRLVRRGDQVMLSSGGGGIRVQVKGEALEDGAAGERISVLNLRSERVVEGVVSASGEVVVGGGAML